MKRGIIPTAIVLGLILGACGGNGGGKENIQVPDGLSDCIQKEWHNLEQLIDSNDAIKALTDGSTFATGNADDGMSAIATVVLGHNANTIIEGGVLNCGVGCNDSVDDRFWNRIAYQAEGVVLDCEVKGPICYPALGHRFLDGPRGFESCLLQIGSSDYRYLRPNATSYSPSG